MVAEMPLQVCHGSGDASAKHPTYHRPTIHHMLQLSDATTEQTIQPLTFTRRKAPGAFGGQAPSSCGWLNARCCSFGPTKCRGVVQTTGVSGSTSRFSREPAPQHAAMLACCSTRHSFCCKHQSAPRAMHSHR